MKRLSRDLLIPVLVLLGPALACAAGDSLFDIVPSGDATYPQLERLEKAGLIESGAGKNPLTRFEVVRLIRVARARFDGIRMVKSDSDELTLAGLSSGYSNAAQTGGPPPTPTPDDSPEALDRAARSLRSLEEAYQYELNAVRDRLKAVQDEAARVDAEHYGLLRRLNGITQFPGIWIHGVGRAFGFSRRTYGASPDPAAAPGVRDTAGYLDLVPEGVVSHKVAWNAMIRVGSGLQPNQGLDGLTLRRVTLEVNPEWMSATLGDFEEAYTPLLLWNRNSLDLRFQPEMVRRYDELSKYEQFMDKEPALPFRGIRLETALMRPGGGLLEQAGMSVFVHMIRNGFNDVATDASYYGPHLYTDWILAGKMGVRSGKAYMGGTTLQAAVDAYGVLLDEMEDSDAPGSTYGKFSPATWVRQYRIGSVRPSVWFGFGDGLEAGVELEMAALLYRDDKSDRDRDIQDHAILGGPFLRSGGSRFYFNFIETGPNFYSPLAQTRQDDLPGPTPGPPVPGATGMFAPDFFRPPVRSRFFLVNVPRPGAIYGYYDRTWDNTFPYGMATPNRRGVGVDLDVKVLKRDSLRIAGSAYLVRETDANAVINAEGTFLVPVDAPPGWAAPSRKFTYVNIGPSFDLGPSLGWKRTLEVGTNVRVERTQSPLGTLNVRSFLGGVRAGLTSFWDLSAAFNRRNVGGSEAGMDGTLWARYPFVFDGADQGRYSVFQVDGHVQSILLSSDLHPGGHSRILLDYDLTSGDLHPYAPNNNGKFEHQYVELTYEVRF